MRNLKFSVKFSQKVEMSRTIDDLTDNLLLSILGQVFGQGQVNVTQVCRRWARIVVDHMTFPVNSFFMAERTEIEYKILKRSRRIFEKMQVMLRYADRCQLYSLREYVRAQKESLRAVLVDLALPLVTKKIQFVSYRDFYIPFYLFEDFQELIYQPQNVRLHKEPINEVLTFPFMQKLVLTLQKRRELQCLNYFHTPLLETFTIDTNCKFADLTIITSFLNRNELNLKCVSITNCHEDFKLVWTVGTLACKSSSRNTLARSDIKFMIPRINELRVFKYSGIPDAAVFDFVMNWGFQIEQVVFENMQLNSWPDQVHQLPRVKQLTLHEFPISEDTLLTLHQLFPNIIEVTIRDQNIRSHFLDFRKLTLQLFRNIERITIE